MVCELLGRAGHCAGNGEEQWHARRRDEVGDVEDVAEPMTALHARKTGGEADQIARKEGKQCRRLRNR